MSEPLPQSSQLSIEPSVKPIPIIGNAYWFRADYTTGDYGPVLGTLIARVQTNPDDAAALMDLASVLRLKRKNEEADTFQHKALSLCTTYIREGAPDGLKLLAIVTAGDFMANTPLDLLIEGSPVNLIDYYVAVERDLTPLPEHDVLIVAIAESDLNRALLEHLQPLLERWPRPVLNRHVQGIIALSRDTIADAFASSSVIVCPSATRISRDDLEHQRDHPWPVIIRPIGSHAGQGLEKIDDADALVNYLARHADEHFFLSPFIDYADEDGRFSKYRIAFIKGHAYIAHMAVSDHWMVHYVSAGMMVDAFRRDREAAAMASFDEKFAKKYANAFDELVAHIGLDYFCIDCAETRDGRLLLFEADTAMVVHTLDDPIMFPYKVPVMKKLKEAFQTLLNETARS